MRVLVTGGSGLLGAELVRQLSGKEEVLAVSRSGAQNTYMCDLRNASETAALFQNASFDLVIHTAAYSDVDGCERNPEEAYRSNALATRYLAEECLSRHIPLVYVSTDYVFDGQKRSPYTEEDPTCPINVYGMTKLAGEHYAGKLGPLCAIVRTSWLFGRGNPNSFVNAIVARLENEKEVGVLDDQEDAPTDVKDLAGALRKAGEYLTGGKNKGRRDAGVSLFHFCNSGSATRYAMALKIKEFLGLKGVEVKRVDRKGVTGRLALRPRYGVMSTRRYEAVFGEKPRSWEEGLREYLCGS
ncbi:MAG: dTDP-4-dehydrorhamnose reductase [Candidatus Omnitrophica bacterium]|nr:dTDP-4-dehydrorhamnose reductase [Candidatus Omnitrophota bacterium]